MKKYMLLYGSILALMTILLSGRAYGQTTFTPHSITNNFSSPAGIFSGDIDLDGDNDVVAGSGVNGITLWKNNGGKPVNWAKQTIDNNSGICLGVFIADIVRDGHPDIVALSTDRNQIMYYKNDGGDPISWSKHIIPGSIAQPHEIYVCDFDLDGNQDIFAAGMSDTGEITWWHNNGGDPVQWTKQIISGNEPGARSVHVGDIDGDGDNDVAAAVFATDEITWWRNDGGFPVTWTKIIVANDFDGSHRIQIADMDSDGDLDILGTAYMAGTIAIWRNNGGNPISWSRHDVDSDFTGAVIAIAKDINSDGWLDIFGTAQASNTVAWYENKGTADLSFRERVIQDDFAGVWPAFAEDIDGDLDIDLLAGGFDVNEIRWYENKQVGRFTNKIDIKDTPTNLGFFVPEEYDPDQEYKMIVALHNCGDENQYSRYRDNLIPLCLELNAIIVSPDCHNTISDLGIPGPEFILEVIEYSKSRFNIDEDFVYMTGGSCNGITTLKYGLEKIYDFRGIIPFNPWIPEWVEGYYDLESDMPVCFALGSLDPNFNPALDIFNQLMENKGRAGFIIMPEIGHQFYFEEVTEVMIECIRIIDSINDNSTAIYPAEVLDKQFKVFPNPFTENLNIQLPESLTGPIEIIIYNLIGQEVYKKTIKEIDNAKSAIQLSFPDQKIPEGQLFLQIKSPYQIFGEKLIRR